MYPCAMHATHARDLIFPALFSKKYFVPYHLSVRMSSEQFRWVHNSEHWAAIALGNSNERFPVCRSFVVNRSTCTPWYIVNYEQRFGRNSFPSAHCDFTVNTVNCSYILPLHSSYYEVHASCFFWMSSVRAEITVQQKIIFFHSTTVKRSSEICHVIW